LGAVVERRVDDALVEVDRVAGAERGRLALDELRDLALLDDDHLLLPRMAVEVVPAARLERHVHHDEVLRPGLGDEAPADRAPGELLLPDGLLLPAPET